MGRKKNMGRYDRIRELREDAGISQRVIAEYLNVHQTTYSSYELGDISIPVRAVVKLADFYGVRVEYIVGLTSERIIPDLNLTK